jgi:hypothetical protein
LPNGRKIARRKREGIGEFLFFKFFEKEFTTKAIILNYRAKYKRTQAIGTVGLEW